MAISCLLSPSNILPPSSMDFDNDDNESFFELELPLSPSPDTRRIGDFISCDNNKLEQPTKKSKLHVFIFGKKKPNFVVKFGRSDSSKTRRPIRFSKDSVHKYLKPLYVKLSTSKSCDSGNVASFSSPRKSEEKPRFSAPVKRLGKSRSAGALLVGAASLKVDSAAHHSDNWIQGAILHCKESFHSSTTHKGRRAMKRCVSDTSNDKSLVEMKI